MAGMNLNKFNRFKMKRESSTAITSRNVRSRPSPVQEGTLDAEMDSLLESLSRKRTVSPTILVHFAKTAVSLIDNSSRMEAAGFLSLYRKLFEVAYTIGTTPTIETSRMDRALIELYGLTTQPLTAFRQWKPLLKTASMVSL